MQRRTVIYRGTVQGVGFRWRACRAVEGLDVTGYVRNRADGTVELVAEAPAASLRAALERIDAALGAYIRDRAETVAPATGEFDGFTIRR
jgi:acylphosphatase